MPTPFVDTNCPVIISEYVEGASNNKAIEIYNPDRRGDRPGPPATMWCMVYSERSHDAAGYTITLTGTIPAAGRLRAGQQFRRGGHPGAWRT